MESGEGGGIGARARAPVTASLHPIAGWSISVRVRVSTPGCKKHVHGLVSSYRPGSKVIGVSKRNRHAHNHRQLQSHNRDGERV